MKELVFPFNGNDIMRRRKKLRKQLVSDGNIRIKKKIAVLGGSTTDHIISALELFLLNNGIEPEFYQSEFNKFYEDAVFGSEKLDSFRPDVIFIHTTSRNLKYIPDRPDISEDELKKRLDAELSYFRNIWSALEKKHSCPIIQNNFELPLFRQTGNYDGWGLSGHSSYISRMNLLFAYEAVRNNNLFINDINYLSAAAGLVTWHDPEAWYMYKYAMSTAVIPDLAYSVASIIKALFGRNKKVIALDLDNTLWGGVISEDGVGDIELGTETAVGMSFSEFQKFLKGYKDHGVLLTVCSKNDKENALAGLNHPDSILSPEDFVLIKANWENKDKNISDTANELGLLTDSFVFIDDNPAECAIVEEQLPETTVLHLSSTAQTMYELSRSGYFEVISVSGEDIRRSEMYSANAKRTAQQKSFTDYADYLRSLDMKAIIGDFQPILLSRIAQLTNKSNQFNLTTKRYSEAEIKALSCSPGYIRLCGRLIDKFGDNGIVSVVIGRIEQDVLHIDLWLMSCRVLKRDMEFAMLDELVRICCEKGIRKIMGYYYRTPKNNMVAELYGRFGFARISVSENGDSVWVLDTKDYEDQNNVIKVNPD
ncbi:MAG: HAD-IIIC family phosphatase [Ruminococcus sp.]|nr:HAD-IIIC family phosphatase [Ruminococcus sp.]